MIPITHISISDPAEAAQLWTRADFADSAWEAVDAQLPLDRLPASGWKMTEHAADFPWKNSAGLRLNFNCYRFKNPYHDIFVFYGQWDPQGYPYHKHIAREQSERLVDAWRGNRKAHKRMLEVIVDGPQNMQQAQKALDQMLNKAIVVQTKSAQKTI